MAHFHMLDPEVVKSRPCSRIFIGTQRDRLIEANKVLCVKIYRRKCPTCRNIAQRYYYMANQYNEAGVCELVRENADDDMLPQELQSQLKGVPAFLIYVEGELKDILYGIDLVAVDEKLKSYLEKTEIEEWC